MAFKRKSKPQRGRNARPSKKKQNIKKAVSNFKKNNKPFNKKKDDDGEGFKGDRFKGNGRFNKSNDRFNKKQRPENKFGKKGGFKSEDGDDDSSKKGTKRKFVSDKRRQKNEGVHYKTKKDKDQKKKSNDKEEDAEIETVPQNYFGDQLLIANNHQSKDQESDVDDEQDIISMMTAAKKKTKTKGGGGFQSMGLSQPILRAVIKKGYKVPTPIQRKTIPLLLEGRDLVGMARTGSGKTAAFLLPLLEKLRIRNPAKPIRGLIMSPTRELALQTYQFARDLGRFTDLKSVCLVGGDSIEKQFATIHENPDIVIATPGRFLHLCIEMNLRLRNVEYLVFDEADRLFELGFQEQLQDILNRLPDSRQTVLFSATLPQLLVDFAKAGLNNPELIRLDVDSKLSENLKTVFLHCRTEDKTAILLYMLRFLIQPKEMTVVFVATRHHVEYLKDILNHAQVPCCYVYSSLDAEARNQNVSQFQEKRVRVLLVTDIAARGIDIPLLDNVINYNFPAKPKLFVHRVGRVARAGRSGTAYSLVGPDEVSLLYDLHMFLDRKIKLPNENSKVDEDGLFGSVPQSLIDDEADSLARWHDTMIEFQNMKRVCANAMKQYSKARPQPSAESVRKMKQLMSNGIPYHPLFKQAGNMATISNDSTDGKSVLELESAREQFLHAMKSYKPTATIFEIGDVKKAKSTAYEIMQIKRKLHDGIVEKRTKNDTAASDFAEIQANDAADAEANQEAPSKKRKEFKDSSFYIPYLSKDHYTEKGLGIETKSFASELKESMFSLEGDDDAQLRKNKHMIKWDRKKKKFVNMAGIELSHKNKKIRTESGALIPASYKTDLYSKWKEKSKANENDMEPDEANVGNKSEIERRNRELEATLKERERMRKAKTRTPKKRPPKIAGLKPAEVILKDRLEKERKESREKWRQERNMSRKKDQSKGGGPRKSGGKGRY